MIFEPVNAMLAVTSDAVVPDVENFNCESFSNLAMEEFGRVTRVTFSRHSTDAPYAWDQYVVHLPRVIESICETILITQGILDA